MLLRLLFALFDDEPRLAGAGGHADRDGRRQT
jgi:hypothetical protein